MHTLAMGDKTNHDKQKDPTGHGREGQDSAADLQPTDQHGRTVQAVQPGAQDRVRLEGEVPAGGRGSSGGSDAAARARSHKKEVASLKRIIGEYAVANEALKKTLEGDRE